MSRLAIVTLLVACGDSPSASSTNPDSSVDALGAAADAAPPALPDPCLGVTAACPGVPAGLTRGGGLSELDRCAFPMSDQGTWSDRSAVIDAFPAALARVSLADVTGDLNRIASTVAAGDVPGDPPGVIRAFTWQSGDTSVTYWIPQGITGSFDGRDDGLVAGKKLVLVSWYHEPANEPGAPDKGVRIAIADVTNPADIRYRFALLVEPMTTGGRSDFAPVRVHAGGLAWFGDLLYIPVTGSGFRVFDLSRILRVDGTDDRIGYNTATGSYDAHGYQYVIPQIGRYVDASACNVVFSYVALDRSSSPPSLISGEYDASTVAGRLFRWPLDPTTGQLQLTDADRVVADGAWLTAESHVQGGLAHADTFWLSSSQPAGGAGALYRTQVAVPSTTLGWIDAPEDLAFDPQANAVWSLSEGINERYVIAVDLGAID
jgi:hypothetical protein